MIHLFNNVYLDLDISVNRPNFSYYIGSPSIKLPIYTECKKAKEGYIELALSEGGEDSFFKKLLSSNENIVLALSPVGFERFYIRFLKTLLPFNDINTLVFIFNTIKQSFALRWSYPYTFAKLTPNQAAAYKEFGNTFKTDTQIKQDWASLPFKLTQEEQKILRMSCSIEFQIATYYCNPASFYASHMLNVLAEIQQDICNSLFKETRQDAFQFLPCLPEFNINETLAKYIGKNSLFLPMENPRVSVDHNIRFAQEIASYIYRKIDEGKRKELFDLYAKDSALEFLDKEKQNKTFYLRSGEYAVTINTYLLNHIFKNSEKPEIIKEFSLE